MYTYYRQKCEKIARDNHQCACYTFFSTGLTTIRFNKNDPRAAGGISTHTFVQVALSVIMYRLYTYVCVYASRLRTFSPTQLRRRMCGKERYTHAFSIRRIIHPHIHVICRLIMYYGCNCSVWSTSLFLVDAICKLLRTLELHYPKYTTRRWTHTYFKNHNFKITST